MKASSWIFGSPTKDFTFLYLFSPLCLLITFISPNLGDESLLFAILATAWIDSGHVYTTIWRTYWNKEERNSHPKYIWTPLLVFIFFFVLFILKIKWVWPLVAYATLFHHIRQNYGVLRWYENINQRQDKKSHFFLYALSILPMIIFHFRLDAPQRGYFSSQDVFLYPDFKLNQISLILWVHAVVFWLMNEFKLYRSGKRELNRFLSVAMPAVMYGTCFMLGKTLTQILFPLLFLHGISYLALISHSLTRTQAEKFKTYARTFLIVGVSAVIFGSLEAWSEENLLVFRIEKLTPITSAALALYLTPLFSHYIFDSWLWKKTHREAALIY